MKRKKSSFLAFMCSLVPGAGEMYIGFMRRGLSVMLIFWGLIFISAWLSLGPLWLGIPIIWFYSFFEVHNLRSMPDEEFYAMEDNYITFAGFNTNKVKLMQNKYRNVFALVLIVIGISILWNNLFDIVDDLLPDYVRDIIYSIGHYFPQMLVGCAIIALGFRLIIGKKKELDMKEQLDMIEDKGGKLL